MRVYIGALDCRIVLFSVAYFSAVVCSRPRRASVLLGFDVGESLSGGEWEAQGERHIRLFAPLTFLWPRTIPAIVDGTAPAFLTVTNFAKALPYSQTQQERAISRNA